MSGRYKTEDNIINKKFEVMIYILVVSNKIQGIIGTLNHKI